MPFVWVLAVPAVVCIGLLAATAAPVLFVLYGSFHHRYGFFVSGPGVFPYSVGGSVAAAPVISHAAGAAVRAAVAALYAGLREPVQELPAGHPRCRPCRSVPVQEHLLPWLYHMYVEYKKLSEPYLTVVRKPFDLRALMTLVAAPGPGFAATLFAASPLLGRRRHHAFQKLYGTLLE